jgi:integrase
MASKVILKKQKASDKEGHLAIQHLHHNKKKIVSLQIKISEFYFDKYFDKVDQQFRRTTLFNYADYNGKIRRGIDDLSCFGIVDPSKTTSFIKYFEKDIDIQINPNTIGVRKSVLKKLVEFRDYKKLKDIPFSIIDYHFIVGLKNFIRLTKEGTTTKCYMDVVKAVLNIAKKDLLYIERYNYFKGLDCRITDTDNSALTKDQLQGLLDIEEDPNIYELTMFLLGVFLHGIRISDLLLLRNDDFKSDKILYYSKKRNKKMPVRYDDKLVSLFIRIVKIPTVVDTNKLNVGIDDILDNYEAQNNKNEIYGATQQLIKHIHSLPKKDLFFKEFVKREPLLLKYNKRFEMTPEEHKAYIRLVVFYNSILEKIVKRCNEKWKDSSINIEKITSHSSRYTFATLALGVEHPDVNAISNALGHSSLKTTMDYFNKNFGKERVEKLGRDFNSDFNL